jgi:hypothetical protein
VRPPDRKYADDGTEIVFVRRWNTLVSVLIVEPSVKLVARTVVDYGLADGQGIYPGNERIARETGYSSESVRHAWATLRALGMAERVTGSYYDGRRRTADEYELAIPAGWRHLPVYGPNLRRFHCQHCGKVFNPRAGTNLHGNGTVGWWLTRMVFCPEPRKGTGCFKLWERDRKAAGEPLWAALKDGAWNMFRRARDDDWPSVAEVTAADQRAIGPIGDLRLA